MTVRWLMRVAVGVAAWSYLAWVIGLALAYRVQVATGGAEGVDVARFLDTAIFSLAWAGFPAVGAVLAARRPGNPVGWMLLLIGALVYGFEPVTEWTELVVARGGRPSNPLRWTAAVVNALAVVPIVAFAHVLLSFPDGLTTRWSRWLSRVALAATALATVVRLLRPGRLDLAVEVANPFGIASMPAGDELVGPLTATVVVVTLLALARLAGRLRRAGGVEPERTGVLLVRGAEEGWP